MTVKRIIQDDRVWVSNDFATYRYGRQYDFNQSGANWVVKGERKPHNYDLTVFHKFLGDAQMTRKSPDGTVLNVGASPFWNEIDVPIPPLSDGQIAALYNNLADKIADSPFDTGVFAGELGESVDLIADAFRSLATGVRAVRKGDMAGAARAFGVPNRLKKAPKALGDAWMANRYGWQPIVNDIYNLSKHIEGFDRVRKRRIVSRVWSEGKATSGITGGRFHPTGAGRMSRQIVAYLEESEKSLGMMLGLANPASVAWELLPWSFVVDWSFPVGNYLRTRSILADTKATYVETYVVQWKARHTDGFFVYEESLGGNTVTVESPVGYINYVEMSRRVKTSLTVPMPHPKNPIGGNPFTRAVDAVNLFVSGFNTLRNR